MGICRCLLATVVAAIEYLDHVDKTVISFLFNTIPAGRVGWLDYGNIGHSTTHVFHNNKIVSGR